MGNVTIRILARQLQLSVATVSKALADSHEISQATKKRVLEMAAAMNYTPNPYASSLRKKKSKTIAVILPEVADSFFAEAINGIEAVAEEQGYHVLICLTHERPQKEESLFRELLGGRADGVLLSVTADTSNPAPLLELQEQGVPIVFFDRVCEGVDTARVVTDDRHSAYMATQHLIHNGCKRIALLTLTQGLSISHQRIEGYKQALADHQLPFHLTDVITCTHDPVSNLRTLEKVLQRRQRPDGLIATVEKLATTAYLACHALQLVIPSEVKLIGFSNLPTAILLQPSLTTITQPAFEMGKAAATILFKALASKNFNLSQQQQVIPSTLIVRGSTVDVKPPAAKRKER